MTNNAPQTPLDILAKGDRMELLALFRFTLDEPDEIILARFGFWARYFFPKYFKQEDAPFHADIDGANLAVYRADARSFTDIVFRGGAKTTRTKLFVCFAILNDKRNFRRYFKVLTKDVANAKQSVTDIYNMLVNDRVRWLYPDTFQKTEQKREESMGAFTTYSGVKVVAGTVGTDQRGALQEDARPDFVWFDDFETRKTLRSAVETQAIWDNMEEARTGLSVNGGCVYTCNYISERGNVHRLVMKGNAKNIVLIVPIVKDGVPAWFHTPEQVGQIREDADDFEGEYLCEPSASSDVLFDRETLNRMERRQPWKEVAGFRMYYRYDPSHRYASGHDISGGVGLDSSTSVFIDFETVPARVVATFDTNTVKPDTFGDEVGKQGEKYGECLVAPERNNHGHATIGRLKQIYPLRKIYRTVKKNRDVLVERKDERKEYGFLTHGGNKANMMFDLAKAVENGHLELSDPKLILEAKSYSRDDVMDGEEDPRLSTRHFDLLTACAIAWQMRKEVGVPRERAEAIAKRQAQVDATDFNPFSVFG